MNLPWKFRPHLLPWTFFNRVLEIDAVWLDVPNCWIVLWIICLGAKICWSNRVPLITVRYKQRWLAIFIFSYITYLIYYYLIIRINFFQKSLFLFILPKTPKTRIINIGKMRSWLNVLIEKTAKTMTVRHLNLVLSSKLTQLDSCYSSEYKFQI